MYFALFHRGPQFNLGGVTNLGYSGEPTATIRLAAVLAFSASAVPATNYNMDVVVTAGGDVTTADFIVTQATDPSAWPTLGLVRIFDYFKLLFESRILKRRVKTIVTIESKKSCLPTKGQWESC